MTDELTITKTYEVEPCGCQWRRTVEFGDVNTPCRAHAPDPLSVTRTDLSLLADSVARKGRDDESENMLAEMCTRHGPTNVQKLDAWFEAKLEQACDRLRGGARQ
jgi:hypothetical protein